MKQLLLILCGSALLMANTAAATLATLKTSVGVIELELFDEDKPVTVSNLIKYAASGRYSNSFVHRWVTNFVFQGGGFFVSNALAGPTITPIPTYDQITNEYNVGRKFSNTYGTIAMARQGGRTNSATSQWFINVTNNVFLDTVDGGFTVFGRVTSGTNVVNLFIPPSPSSIHNVALDFTTFSNLPVLNPNPEYDDLIFTEWFFRRALGLNITRGRSGKTVTWNSVASLTNVLEFSTSLPGQWQVLTNVLGTGNPISISDSSTDPRRNYRVSLKY